MEFRTAFIKWRLNLSVKQVSVKDGVRIDRLIAHCDKHPRLWKSLEHLILHAYERGTESVVIGTPNWDAIFEWIRTQGPTFIRIVLSIVSILLVL